MHKYLIFSFFGMALLALSSCEDAKKSQVLADSLATRLTVLEDSINVQWKRVDADDKNTIRYAQYLLEEIEKTPTHNKTLFDSLKRLSVFLPTQHYTQTTLGDSSIDNYDNLINQLTDGLDRLVHSVPGLDSTSQVMIDLAGFKNASYGQAISMRSTYESYISEYNQILKTHADLIRRKKPDFKLPSPKPGFAPQEKAVQ